MATIGRNSPCPCGSGRKYKRCCGAPTTGRAAADSRGGPANSSTAGTTSRAVRLGLGYLTGAGAKLDSARGVTMIEEAAQAGDAQGNALAASIASCSFWRPCNWELAFDYLARAAELGHQPSRDSLRILAGGPSGGKADSVDWARMRKDIDLAAWLAPPQARLLCGAPRVQAFAGFVPPEACDWLIARARDLLVRATIYDNKTGGTTEDSRRTNSQCDLGIDICGVLTFVLRARIGAVTQRHDLAMEVPKVLHYAPGETFAAHVDFLDPDEPAFASQLAGRGQRTDTFLIYLNEDFSGGQTHFPRLEISHKGAKGDALLFANVNAEGLPDPDTIHVGMPPTAGEKWLFSQWIRALPRQ